MDIDERSIPSWVIVLNHVIEEFHLTMTAFASFDDLNYVWFSDKANRTIVDLIGPDSLLMPTLIDVVGLSKNLSPDQIPRTLIHLSTMPIMLMLNPPPNLLNCLLFVFVHSMEPVEEG